MKRLPLAQIHYLLDHQVTCTCNLISTTFVHMVTCSVHAREGGDFPSFPHIKHSCHL